MSVAIPLTSGEVADMLRWVDRAEERLYRHQRTLPDSDKQNQRLVASAKRALSQLGVALEDLEVSDGE